MDPIQKQIDETVKGNPIVVYGKGTSDAPACGFSKAVFDIFSKLGVDFKSIDVLSNPELREGVKQYTQWPTLPQIFIKGEFVGGCDIVRELFAKGDLEKMVKT